MIPPSEPSVHSSDHVTRTRRWPGGAGVNYWRKLSRILAVEGTSAFLAAIARKPFKYLRNRQRRGIGESFDKTFGLDTGFHAAEEEAFPAMAPETQQGYDPVPIDTFRKTLQLLPIQPKEFSFIDLGSGKGRALILAAEFGFRRVVGVEYSRHYHEVAVRNLDSYRKQAHRGHAIELVHGDATEFDLKGSNVIFLFNPFQGSAFARLVRNLERVLSKGRGNTYLIYVNPVCRKQLDSLPDLHILHETLHRDPYQAFVIYRA